MASALAPPAWALDDVLAAAGARGTVINAVALNDHRVDIPGEDAARNDVMRTLDVT